jgi:hypothetical protein
LEVLVALFLLVFLATSMIPTLLDAQDGIINWGVLKHLADSVTPSPAPHSALSIAGRWDRANIPNVKT